MIDFTGVPMFMWIALAAVCVFFCLPYILAVLSFSLGLLVLVWGVLIATMGVRWATIWLGLLAFLALTAVSVLVFTN